jgi:hypothetical protein
MNLNEMRAQSLEHIYYLSWNRLKFEEKKPILEVPVSICCLNDNVAQELKNVNLKICIQKYFLKFLVV